MVKEVDKNVLIVSVLGIVAVFGVLAFMNSDGTTGMVGKALIKDGRLGDRAYEGAPTGYSKLDKCMKAKEKEVANEDDRGLYCKCVIDNPVASNCKLLKNPAESGIDTSKVVECTNTGMNIVRCVNKVAEELAHADEGQAA